MQDLIVNLLTRQRRRENSIQDLLTEILNNTENSDQNILDEDKAGPLAPQKQIIEPITKKPLIIQFPLMAQKNGYSEINYNIIKNSKRGKLRHSVNQEFIKCSYLQSNNNKMPNDIELGVGLSQVSNNLNNNGNNLTNQRNTWLNNIDTGNNNLSNKGSNHLGNGTTNKLSSGENNKGSGLINNLSNAKNNLTSGLNNLEPGLTQI